MMTATTMHRRLIRTKEAATYLSMSEWKLRRLIQDGTVPFVQDHEGSLPTRSSGSGERFYCWSVWGRFHLPTFGLTLAAARDGPCETVAWSLGYRRYLA